MKQKLETENAQEKIRVTFWGTKELDQLLADIKALTGMTKSQIIREGTMIEVMRILERESSRDKIKLAKTKN